MLFKLVSNDLSLTCSANDVGGAWCYGAFSYVHSLSINDAYKLIEEISEKFNSELFPLLNNIKKRDDKYLQRTL